MNKETLLFAHIQYDNGVRARIEEKMQNGERYYSKTYYGSYNALVAMLRGCRRDKKLIHIFPYDFGNKQDIELANRSQADVQK